MYDTQCINLFIITFIITTEMKCKTTTKTPTKGNATNYDFLQIWIGKYTEVAYTDLVLLCNFNRHIDKPNLIGACIVGLQYSHMIKLLLVHDVRS